MALKKMMALLLVAAAPAAYAQEVLQADNDWFVKGREAVAAREAVTPILGRAKNVILFTGDGMGVGTNYAIRLAAGQRAGGLGDDFVLPYEAFPYTALVRTYSTNGQTPDSAPTASAMNTGIKTKNDLINVTDAVAVGDCAAGLENGVTTLAEISAGMGKSVGVVTTTRITHATPAAVYARTANRDWEDNAELPEGCAQKDIAAQLIDQMKAGVIDVAMGGGRRHFLPASVTDGEGKEGRRTDGRNLVEEAGALGAQYAWNSETFSAIDPAAGKPVLGLFESSHMLYEADRKDEPSLAEMTEAAIKSLSGNGEGFYLSVEGGRIDHANHDGNLARAVTDGEALAAAVAKAVELTNPEDTLIIVTADHEHALAFNGYCGRGSSITGLCLEIDEAGNATTGEPVKAEDGKPFTVAGYLNGAGSILTEEAQWTGTRPADLTDEMAKGLDYKQQALVPLSGETHSGEDVAAFARGPWSHLVSGSIEQNELFHVMLKAMTAE